MRPQDLNLLMVFDAIMTEGSITRAADRLSMTQPAVSNAVSRMRVAWKDELFVKDGRNIQPTQKARNLWLEVQGPLRAIGQAVDPKAFDAATSERTFRVAAAAGVVDLAWPHMRQIIEAEAPGIALHAVPYNIVNGEQLLNDADVDMLVAVTTMMPALDSLPSAHLYDSTYKCVMRKGHPLAKPDLSLEEFAAADHLLVSLSGDVVGFTDRLMAQRGLKRRIAMSVNQFQVVVQLLESSDLITVLPTITVEAAMTEGKLVVTECPIDVPSNSISAFWHRRQDRDTGLRWLRDKLAIVLRSRIAAHEAILRRCLCR